MAATSENLNYSAQGLLKIFPKYFTQDTVANYARQPEKIANRVYANRLGNGDEASGDGWRNRGRGLFQLTGKDNYAKAGAALGKNYAANPELVALPEDACLTAGWYWNTHNLNTFADMPDSWRKVANNGKTYNGFEYVSYVINGGENGLAERKVFYELAKKALGA